MGSKELKQTPSTSLMEIAGEITLKNIPQKMQQAINKTLQIKNPTYEAATRSNPKARYAVKQFYKYFREDKQTGDLTIGRGCQDSIRTYARRCNIEIQETDKRVIRPVSQAFDSTIELRDYQRGVVDRIVERDSSTVQVDSGNRNQPHQGIIKADTGAGKTVLGIELITRLQQKTLIIVPKLDLLNQWVNEIKRWTNIENIGVVQGTNCTDANITVATIQSLKKYLDKGTITGDGYGCVITDEAHLFVSAKRMKVLQCLNSKYFFGLTATNRRTDGQGLALNWVFGPVLVDLKMERATPTIHLIEFRDHIWMQEYSDIIEDQTTNEKRNKLIVDTLEDVLERRKRNFLVLTKRVKHYETLAQQLREKIGDDGIIELSSRAKKEDRDTLLASLRNGSLDFKVIFSTYGLAATGLDIPRIDSIMFAGDLKSDVLAEQGVGRCLRLLEGKDDPIVLDVWDTGNLILRRQGKLRQKFYEEQAWTIKKGL